MNWREYFTERELKEIEYCWLYLRDFQHGTDGHNIRIIVGKFAAIMEVATIAAIPSIPDKPK